MSWHRLTVILTRSYWRVCLRVGGPRVVGQWTVEELACALGMVQRERMEQLADRARAARIAKYERREFIDTIREVDGEE